MVLLSGNEFIFSQIFALIALVLDLCSFRNKSKTGILLFLAPSTIFIGLHYLLLDKDVTAILYVVAFSRLATSYFVQDEYNRRTFSQTYLIIQSVLLLLFYDEPITLIPYVAHCIFIIGTFQRDDRELRLVFMLGTVLIIFYNIIIFSPAAILLETVYMCSNILFFYKYYVKDKAKEKEKEKENN